MGMKMEKMGMGFLSLFVFILLGSGFKWER